MCDTEFVAWHHKYTHLQTDLSIHNITDRLLPMSFRYKLVDYFPISKRIKNYYWSEYQTLIN